MTLPARRILALSALLAAVWATACSAQSPPMTLDPVMSKGPDSAPVTIVEFSDYQ